MGDADTDLGHEASGLAPKAVQILGATRPAKWWQFRWRIWRRRTESR